MVFDFKTSKLLVLDAILGTIKDGKPPAMIGKIFELQQEVEPLVEAEGQVDSIGIDPQSAEPESGKCLTMNSLKDW